MTALVDAHTTSAEGAFRAAFEGDFDYVCTSLHRLGARAAVAVRQVEHAQRNPCRGAVRMHVHQTRDKVCPVTLAGHVQSEPRLPEVDLGVR